MPIITAEQRRQQLGLYSQREAAKVCGITQRDMYHAVNYGYIPKPTTYLGKARFYQAKELPALIEFFQKPWKKKPRKTK